jgi:hypothetical protein
MLSAAMIEKSNEKSSGDVKKEAPMICKPSELPIYTSLVDRLLQIIILIQLKID